MWARFTVLRDTPIDSAIAGCVIPFSRSNTIWMRWRCWGCPFQRSAVFKRRSSFLVHLTTCSSESNQIRWSVRIILRLTNAIHIRIRCFATVNIRFNQLSKRYEVRKRLNAVLRGWSAYFGYGTRLMAYRTVDNYVDNAVRCFLRRRHKVRGRGTNRFSAERIFGSLGVLRLRRVHLGPLPCAIR